MFTEKALLKAKVDLFNILANHSKRDYMQANYTAQGKKKRKKHIPYSLSEKTREAQTAYNLVFGKGINDITEEQEEQVKGFLIPYRTFRTEFLEDAGGKAYHN